MKKSKDEIIVQYKCPICNTVFNTRESAEKCYARGRPEPAFKKGDLVSLLGFNLTIRKVHVKDRHEAEYEFDRLIQTQSGDLWEDNQWIGGLKTFCEMRNFPDPRFVLATEYDLGVRKN